jgi:hypothetical protein
MDDLAPPVGVSDDEVSAGVIERRANENAAPRGCVWCRGRLATAVMMRA